MDKIQNISQNYDHQLALEFPGDSSINLADSLFKQAIELSYHYVGKKNYGSRVEDAEAANDLLRQALKINPKHEDSLNLYAQNLRLILKDYRKAIKVYSRLIEINPTYENAIFRRGLCKSMLKDYSGQLDDFNRSITANKKEMTFENFVSRAFIKEKLKDYEGAICDLKEANRLSDLSPFLRYMLGNLLSETGAAVESLRHLELAMNEEKIVAKSKSLKIPPPNPLLYKIYDSHISTLIKLKRYPSARNTLVEMKNHYPARPRTVELNNLLKTLD